MSCVVCNCCRCFFIVASYISFLRLSSHLVTLTHHQPSVMLSATYALTTPPLLRQLTYSTLYNAESLGGLSLHHMIC